jgi:thiol:disulfide interchange protein DsbA
MKTIATATLFLLVTAFGAAHAQTAPPTVGKDYIEISNGRPLDPVANGSVVVEEFFNYICPACNAFEPLFVAWAARQPDYVKIVHIPATFRADFVPYAKAYYAAVSLNLAEKAHADVYTAIHRDHSLPAEGDRPSEERVAEFYAKYGVDAATFLAAMRSFGNDVKVRRATEYMQRARVPSTPTIVVNGRYLVRGDSYQDMLRIASFLIEKEHSRAAGGGSTN